MSLAIGNAPCSWGVEVPDAPSNPPWRTVLDETARAGYRGIELGPIGYAPEDAALLQAELDARGLALTAGVLYRPFHDGSAWEELRNALHRTCRLLAPLGAKHLVLIDSVASARSPYAGDPQGAPRLAGAELAALHQRVRETARTGREQYGLSVSLHAHAGGYIEFEDELDIALDAIDASLLGVCLDTGHSLYAGFDPVACLRRYAGRVAYIHLKDLDAATLRQCVAARVGFYEACARGAFCNLGQGAMDFGALLEAIQEVGYGGWLTVEQDRGPLAVQSSFEDARANFAFLVSRGLAT